MSISSVWKVFQGISTNRRKWRCSKVFYDAVQGLQRGWAYFYESIWTQVTEAIFSFLSSKPFSAQIAQNLLWFCSRSCSCHSFAGCVLLFFFLPTCLSVSAETPFTAMFVKNTFVHLCVNAYTHSHTLFCIQINPIHLSHFPHLGRSHGTLQFSSCPTLGGLVLVWQICCYFSHCWTTGSLQIVSWNRLDGR